MDVDTESKESTASVIQPPKEKKLKQTRLPFQMMPSSGSPNTSNKKRKLSSPSPNSCKSPKVQKIGKKENSLKCNDVVEVELTVDKNDEKSESDTTTAAVDSTDTPSRLSKPEAKGSLFKYFTKTTNSSKQPPVIDQPPSLVQELKAIKLNLPIVLLNRCDDENNIEPSIASNDSLDDFEKSNIKSDDSSNDVLAEPLPDSDNDEDQNSLDKTQDSPTESESEMSFSDDDNTDEKKINEETGDTEKASNDINIEKTDESDKQVEKINKKKQPLTPKQVQRKLISAEKRESRRKLKAEREQKRIMEKEELRRVREEKRQEIQKKKEVEIEAKKKEKEQKEMKRQLENEQKQKEREQKEKEREQKEKAKEEEKRKKEEERLEAERKKQKAASTFVSFFKKQDNKISDDVKIIEKITSNFMPFEIKADMKVAPTCRRHFNNIDKSNFDSTCLTKTNKPPSQLWLDEVRKNKSKIRKSGKTWPAESKDDIVVLEEDDVDNANIVDQTTAVTEKQRAKLLSFTENRRPPYWGTWRKKSKKINPKKPFKKDTKWFDYDVDSDEEWEEEEPGESLHGSDDEKEEENADDNEYDVDNEFMVPHGYLSDEEAQADEEDEEDMTPETQKFKLKILGEQFEAEMNEKTAKIKPRVIGSFWQNSENNFPENTPASIVKFLTARQAWIREIPIALSKPIEPDTSNNTENINEKSRGAKKTRVPDEALLHLIKLIHGNTQGRSFLVKEFITFWSKMHPDEGQLSKVSVANKIGELGKRLACPEEGPMYLKQCWYVSEEIRKQYLDEELKLPNQWSYILTPKRKIMLDESSDKLDKELKEKFKEPEKIKKEQKDKIEKEQKDNKDRKSAPLITQFTQKLTTEGLKKQLTVKPTSPSVKSSNQLNRPPKRATLISVPRGGTLPSTTAFPVFTKIPEIVKSDLTVKSSADDKISPQDDEVVCVEQE